MQSDNVASGPPALGRRAIVAGGGAVALGVLGALSGCGTPASGGGSPGGPTTAGGSGAAGTTLGAAAEIPVGGGKVFESLEVVVTQPTAGRYTGLSAICTHTGCIVDKVADGTIDCPCHGSRYHLDGTVANGPAPRALASRPVKVVNGTITLT